MLQGAGCGWVYAALSNVAEDSNTVGSPATPRLRVLGPDLKLPENMAAKKAPGQPPALDCLDLLFSSTSAPNYPKASFRQSATVLNSFLLSWPNFGLS